MLWKISSCPTDSQLYSRKTIKDPEYNGPQLNVVLISDDSLNISRSAYDGPHLASLHLVVSH